MYDEYRKSIDSGVCHKAWSNFVIDRASLFTDHRISGRPIRAKYKRFRTIWEHTLDNSPTDPISSSLNWWSSRHDVAFLWDPIPLARLWSILLWIVRAYLLTIKYRVIQFLPNLSISEQFESIHVTSLPQISILPLWSRGHRCKE